MGAEKYENNKRHEKSMRVKNMTTMRTNVKKKKNTAYKYVFGCIFSDPKF